MSVFGSRAARRARPSAVPERPVRIYSAPVPAQAHILRGALEAAGIPAEVRGDQRTTLAGGLPVDACFAEVWVHARDLDASERILQEMLPTGGPSGALSIADAAPEGGELGLSAEWRCAGCGEDNPPSFELCWSCQTPAGPSRSRR